VWDLVGKSLVIHAVLNPASESPYYGFFIKIRRRMMSKK
jgi:hypothetical protein